MPGARPPYHTPAGLLDVCVVHLVLDLFHEVAEPPAERLADLVDRHALVDIRRDPPVDHLGPDRSIGALEKHVATPVGRP
eukprot:13865734-Alexandrium_andersonii.AAC.1